MKKRKFKNIVDIVKYYITNYVDPYADIESWVNETLSFFYYDKLKVLLIRTEKGIYLYSKNKETLSILVFLLNKYGVSVEEYSYKIYFLKELKESIRIKIFDLFERLDQVNKRLKNESKDLFKGETIKDYEISLSYNGILNISIVKDDSPSKCVFFRFYLLDNSSYLYLDKVTGSLNNEIVCIINKIYNEHYKGYFKSLLFRAFREENNEKNRIFKNV